MVPRKPVTGPRLRDRVARRLLAGDSAQAAEKPRALDFELVVDRAPEDGEADGSARRASG
ncbi:hypothetical protein GCM10011490_03490 [Pseudoclavibacter endophyticus]|nr:hypothetical protein GCM10011490_03490 [Pseudoclavibacter endophyticus]